MKASEDDRLPGLEDLARALRRGETTAAALLERASDRHRRFGPSLSAYLVWDEEGAGRRARAADAAFSVGADLGPLQGLPCSVKDLYGVAGLRTHAGSPRPLPVDFEQEGPLVQCLGRQLAVITGKTHTVEFAFGGLGSNSHWPTPRNPWDGARHRLPGGSSAGAGVSLLEGSADFALGTDTAGSVRVPASFTGTVGLKTSPGRWPTAGIVPLSPTLDTAGLLARTVADAAWAFAALDPHWGEPESLRHNLDRLGGLDGRRLGVPERHFWDDASPGVAEAVRQALGELELAGAELVAVELPEADGALELFRRGALVAVELSELLATRLPEWLPTLDPVVSRRLVASEVLPAVEYLRRLRRLRELADAADDRLAAVDAFVTPTVAITPPTVDEAAGDYDRLNYLALRNTAAVSFLGLAGLSLPVGLDRQGMPVGLQLAVRAGREEDLLALALAAEEVLGSGRERLGLAALVAG